MSRQLFQSSRSVSSSARKLSAGQWGGWLYVCRTHTFFRLGRACTKDVAPSAVASADECDVIARDRGDKEFRFERGLAVIGCWRPWQSHRRCRLPRCGSLGECKVTVLEGSGSTG